MLAATVACAGETLIVSNVLGPEGPLNIDGNLYYVGWVSNTLSKWDGKTTTVLNHTPGCGHNGLALTKQRTFLLACTEEHGAILELDMTGEKLRRCMPTNTASHSMAASTILWRPPTAALMPRSSARRRTC